MLRKLVRTLLSVPLITAPMAVWGLGLGEIQLNSALNQPLDAEIALLSVEPGAADSIKVALASYETFAKFGLDRPSNLMFLRFGVEQGPSGGYQVKVTTERPVREPFLDFLIELEWRQGRLLREYTLLLDPPDMVAEAPPRLAAPRAAAAKGAVPPAASVAAPRAPRVSTAGQSLSYGPIRPDDTLWSIAKQMRPDGHTIKQTMMALFQANPDAFLDNNINKLRKGAVLRLQDPSAVAAISAAEAEQEVARQSRRWEELKRELGEQGGARPASESQAAPDGAVAAAQGPKLTLVAPAAGGPAEALGQQGGGSGTTNADALRGELMRALEEAEARGQESRHLRERVAELEGQIASMQRLLSLKSDDLAKLQGQLGKTDATGATADTPAEAAKPEKPEKPQPTAQQPKPAAKPKPKPAPQPVAPEPGLIDMLLANMTALGIGVVALMVAGLGLVWARRRRTGGFQESILTGGTSSMLSPKDEEGGSSMETSFLSDLASDGIGAPVHDAEVDPLTEADVYLAYGRHQQAEELLRDAIQENPERHELLGKLMEVYYKTKNKAAFMAQVEAAHATLDGHGPVWDKIAAMGHEFAPAHPLFTDAPAAPIDTGDDTDTSVAIDDVLDIGLDLDALAAEMEPGDDAELDLDLGVDLSEFDEPSAPGQGKKGTAEVGDDIDLDFAVAVAPATEVEEEDPLANLDFGSAESDDSMAGLDLDFAVADAPKPAALDIGSTEPEDDAGGLDFDFDIAGPEGAVADLGPDTARPASPAAGLAFEPEDAAGGLGLDLDFDMAEPEGVAAGLELDVAEPEVPVAGPDLDFGSGKVEPLAASDALEFELDGFELPEVAETPAAATEPAAAAGGQADDTMSLEFGVELADLAEADALVPELSVTAESAAEDEAPSMAFGDPADAAGLAMAADEDGMPGLGLEFDEGELPAAALAGLDAPDLAGEPEFGDLAGMDGDDLLKEFDLGGLDDNDFGNLDEVGTKLDLATAYVEMGDADGARDMLEEVLQEGDAEQKQKAQELLDQIAAQA